VTLRQKLEMTRRFLDAVVYHDPFIKEAALACFAAGVNLCLIGPRGTLKSHTCKALMACVEPGGAYMERGLLGKSVESTLYTPHLGKLVREGKVVVERLPVAKPEVWFKVFDEVQRLGADALVGLFSLLGREPVSYFGRTIDFASPGDAYIVWATMNPMENDPLCTPVPWSNPLWDRFQAFLWVPAPSFGNKLKITRTAELGFTGDMLIKAVKAAWVAARHDVLAGKDWRDPAVIRKMVDAAIREFGLDPGDGNDPRVAGLKRKLVELLDLLDEWGSMEKPALEPWTRREVYALWETVSKVAIPERHKTKLLLVLSAISFCEKAPNYDGSSLSPDQRGLACSRCGRKDWVCSELSVAPSVREITSVVRVAKGFAFVRGHTEVSWNDIEDALFLTLWTRLEFKGEEYIFNRAEKLRDYIKRVVEQVSTARDALNAALRLVKRYDKNDEALLDRAINTKPWLRVLKERIESERETASRILRKLRPALEAAKKSGTVPLKAMGVLVRAHAIALVLPPGKRQGFDLLYEFKLRRNAPRDIARGLREAAKKAKGGILVLENPGPEELDLVLRALEANAFSEIRVASTSHGLVATWKAGQDGGGRRAARQVALKEVNA